MVEKFQSKFEKVDKKKIIKVEWSQHDSTGCRNLSSEK